MDKSIAKLLGEDALPPELLASLQEAFDKKVTEVRAEAEMSVREEFAARYDHDKAQLVEAMDAMLSAVVQKHAEEHAAAVSKFTEARTAFRKAVKEARGKYATKLEENLTRSRTFVSEQLTKEIKQLRETKKKIVSERLKDADRIASLKETLKTEHNARLKKIDEFVLRQVRKELKEFDQDHRSLIETRAKLVTEGRKRLRETQTRFVKEAAKNVEKAVTTSLAREMTQLHEDLERNRQNMFGRRIFEAFAGTYMSSYLAEGTEIRKLQEMVASKDQALTDATARLSEAVKTGQQAVRKVREADERATRTKILSELLGTLGGEKRKVMEGMLETVKTDALRPSFNRLLDVVLDEHPRRTAPARKPLVETDRAIAPRPARTGGNQGAERLFETANAELNELDDDIAKVVRLAGISKN